RTMFVDAAGIANVRPYDLRHSFVSLLIAEGRSIVDVARQAGHSPTMALDTYGHVFDELDGSEQLRAEDAIREARAALYGAAGAPSESGCCLRKERNSAFCRDFLKPSNGLEPLTPSLPWRCSTS